MPLEDETIVGVIVAIVGSLAALPAIDTFAFAENLRRTGLRMGEEGKPEAQMILEELAATVAQMEKVKGGPS